MASIQGIYVALFGRPADPLGLQYFNQATGNGANLNAIGDLAATAEYQSRFEGMDNASIVTAIYQSLFGRNPELAGLTFFVDALNNGTININNVAIAILDGAQGDDLATVTNKITAADAFTAAIDTPDELAAYRGDAAADAGRAFISPITSDAATIPTAEATDTSLLAIVNGTTTVGDIFTLAAASAGVSGIDLINGTAGNDTIRAIDANSLTSSDVVHGGAGSDTLNISAGAYTGTIAPVIDGVEIINDSATGATFDLTSVTGVEKIWAGGAVATYTNASIDTLFGAAGTANQTINVDYTGTLAGETTAHLGSTLATGITGTFDFGADAAKIEHVTIDAVSGAGTVALDADLDALASIVVTGAGRVTVTSVETTLTSFDASANTGGVTYVSGATAEAVTVKGGDGLDTLNFSAATKAVTVDAGAGNDVVNGGAGDDTINGGAGNDTLLGNAGKDIINGGEGNDIITGGLGADTLTGGAGNDTFVYTALGDSDGTTLTTIDIITDFTSGSDKIDVSGLGITWTFTTAAQQISIENAIAGLAADATLAQAEAAVAAITADDTIATFEFGGNTYVYGETAGTDLLVQLTGSVAVSHSDITIA